MTADHTDEIGSDGDEREFYVGQITFALNDGPGAFKKDLSSLQQQHRSTSSETLVRTGALVDSIP